MEKTIDIGLRTRNYVKTKGKVNTIHEIVIRNKQAFVTYTGYNGITNLLEKVRRPRVKSILVFSTRFKVEPKVKESEDKFSINYKNLKRCVNLKPVLN